MDIPTLETERLTLRAPRMDDWPAYAALMGSDRAKYMGGPHTKKDAWGMFCHDTALWSLFEHGALMIEERATGHCLGQVGVNHGPLFPEPELGWFVYVGAEGRGVAFEAAEAMRDWAIGERELLSLVSYVDPDNARSRKLAERLGAWLDAEAPRDEEAVLVYRHR